MFPLQASAYLDYTANSKGGSTVIYTTYRDPITLPIVVR